MADLSGNLFFILGGARSGKSDFASRLAKSKAEEQGARLVYLATAPAAYAGVGVAPDSEMARRIQAHKTSRGSDWDTIEEPLEVVRVIEEASADSVLLVDCLTLWITNLIEQGLDDGVVIERAVALSEAAAKAARPVIVVSNEVGQGIVPQSALGRRFRDLAGTVHQRVAARAREVYFVTAGIAQKISSGSS
jgi:adenosylcobinamide kinase/adenosylcobinamide-phosphate guanylyltransferase